jgi:hypothetical protein
MSKTTKKTKAENPEVEQPQIENTQPAFVKELQENGVVIISGRTLGELYEKLATIPSNINFYTGAVGYYIDKSLYRIQVNIKED